MTLLNKIAPPLVADLIGLVLILLLLPPLGRQFENLGFINSVWMGFFFVLFCLAVYGLKKLRPFSPQSQVALSFLLEKQTLGGFGVLFALSISTATAYVVGFLDSVILINRGLLDEPSVTIYLLLTPASWFGLSLIYMLLLTSETEAIIDPQTARYGIVSILGLAGVNLMGAILTAVWQALWQRFSGVGGAAWIVALNLVLFLFLLGPPRLIYIARNRNLISLLTFLPVLVYLAILAAP